MQFGQLLGLIYKNIAVFACMFFVYSVNAEPILFQENNFFKVRKCEGVSNVTPLALSSSIEPDFFEAFLKSVNPHYDTDYVLDMKGEKRNYNSYKGIVGFYNKWCSSYGVRWDWAFMQMLLETDYLRYTGSVPPQQFNFAGLAATDDKSKGEDFMSLSHGVKAHCQHLAAYALVDLPNKICQSEELENVSCLEAKRTYEVKDKIIRHNVCKQFGRPAQFSELGPDDYGPCSVKFTTEKFKYMYCPKDIVQWASGPKAVGYFFKIRFIYKKFLDKIMLCKNAVNLSIDQCKLQNSNCVFLAEGKRAKSQTRNEMLVQCISKR